MKLRFPWEFIIACIIGQVIAKWIGLVSTWQDAARSAYFLIVGIFCYWHALRRGAV